MTLRKRFNRSRFASRLHRLLKKSIFSRSFRLRSDNAHSIPYSRSVISIFAVNFEAAEHDLNATDHQDSRLNVEIDWHRRDLRPRIRGVCLGISNASDLSKSA